MRGLFHEQKRGPGHTCRDADDETQCHRLLIFIVRGIALNGGLIGDQIGRRSYSKVKRRSQFRGKAVSILRPSGLAVVMLITSSNFVNRWTGRSAGLHCTVVSTVTRANRGLSRDRKSSEIYVSNRVKIRPDPKGCRFLVYRAFSRHARFRQIRAGD